MRIATRARHRAQVFFQLILLSPFAAFAGESAQSVEEALAAVKAASALHADRVWVLVAAAMVMFMQAGFLALEVGSVRPHAMVITAMKNVVDWVICAVAFFLVGWGLMFGHSAGGLIGSDFMLLGGDPAGGHPIGLWVHFLFNLAFAGTAATIVSGAMAERTGFIAYLVCSVVVTTAIYPVIGHWVWGNGFFGTNATLLSRLGFLDFAGSTVVHSVGGWVSLVGISIVGPRLGRFGPDGKPKAMTNSMAWTGLGALLLWFSWWGFNGGSTLTLDDQVGSIINNTNLAGAAGALGALAHCAWFQRKDGITEKFLCGALAGLVGITASCNLVSPLSALFIGASSGVISNVATDLLLRLRLDDPVGAVPVHLCCGIWGTLCVGIFGDPARFPLGHTRLEQIGVQAIGVFATAAWVVPVSWGMFKLLKAFVGLRVSPLEETVGFDIGGVVPHTEAQLDEKEATQLMGGV